MTDGYVQIDATLLGNAHNNSSCAGQPCVIHNPSDHHMRQWTRTFNDVTVSMSRICPHQLIHPDPDDLVYHRRKHGDTYAAGAFVHMCDGCCQPPPVLLRPASPAVGTVSVEPQ